MSCTRTGANARLSEELGVEGIGPRLVPGLSPSVVFFLGMETHWSSVLLAREPSMTQPSAELEKLQAELVETKDSVIEAHQKLQEERRASYDVKIALRSAEEKLATCREDLGKTLDLLDAQKVKFAMNQLLLEEARR